MKAYVPLGLLGVLCAGAALAQAPSFEEVDANMDGQIDQSEAAVVEGLDFATADANQDGHIDRAEWTAATGQ
jgi:hypothetical protein